MRKNNLWFYRKEAGLKQRELSSTSSYCISYLSRIEQGHYSPSKRCATALAKALKVSVGELFPIKKGLSKTQPRLTGAPTNKRTEAIAKAIGVYQVKS